jgi:hypothetical protein
VAVVNGGQSEVKRRTADAVVERIAYADTSAGADILPPLSVTLYKPRNAR